MGCLFFRITTLVVFLMLTLESEVFCQVQVPIVFSSTLSQSRINMGTAANQYTHFFMGGNAGGVYTNAVDYWNSKTGAWTSATLSIGRDEGAAVAVGSQVVFAGGRDWGGYHDRVDIFDMSTSTWTTAALSQVRALIGAAAVGDKAYFCGGLLGDNSDATLVDVYDSSTGLWTTLSSGSTTHIPPTGVTSVGDYLVIYGGYPDSNSVDLYNTQTDSWTFTDISPIPADAASVGNLLFFSGADSSSAVVNFFDANSAVWQTATLSQARGYAFVVAYQDTVLFLGGVGSTGELVNVIDSYNTTSGQWASGYFDAGTWGGKTVYDNAVIFISSGSNDHGFIVVPPTPTPPPPSPSPSPNARPASIYNVLAWTCSISPSEFCANCDPAASNVNLNSSLCQSAQQCLQQNIPNMPSTYVFNTGCSINISAVISAEAFWNAVDSCNVNKVELCSNAIFNLDGAFGYLQANGPAPGLTYKDCIDSQLTMTDVGVWEPTPFISTMCSRFGSVPYDRTISNGTIWETVVTSGLFNLTLLLS